MCQTKERYWATSKFLLIIDLAFGKYMQTINSSTLSAR